MNCVFALLSSFRDTKLLTSENTVLTKLIAVKKIIGGTYLNPEANGINQDRVKLSKMKCIVFVGCLVSNVFFFQKTQFICNL
jgi:hypothetical protein